MVKPVQDNVQLHSSILPMASLAYASKPSICHYSLLRLEKALKLVNLPIFLHCKIYEALSYIKKKLI